jgi:Cys-Gly metallodipeptidase DUG1
VWVGSHGVEGAFSTTGAKTVIPAKVTGMLYRVGSMCLCSQCSTIGITGKFSIRLVPDLEPAKVSELVIKHLEVRPS